MSFGKSAALALTLTGIFLLSACGGGGGSDQSGNTGPTASNASPASNAAAPSAASSTTASTELPSSASAPSAASSPVTAGESLPSLAAPQAGSTALTGTNAEGIWTSSSIANYSVALVDSTGNISTLNALGSFVISELYGVISSTAQAWTLTSGWSFGRGAFAYPTTAGSGAYAAQKTFTGSYVADGVSNDISLTYDPANALSVTQQSVEGTWSQSSTFMTISNGGFFTGKLSGCTVSGTMSLAAPGTNHNMYSVTMSAAKDSLCAMPAGMTFTGNAAIVFLPIKGSNGYQRTIVYNVKNLDGLRIAYGQLVKQ